MTGFSVSFLFLATVTLDFSPVIFVVLTVVFCTVMEMTCFLPLASVMVTFGFSGFQAFHRSLAVYRNDFLIAGSPAFNGITLCKSRNLYFGSRLFYFQLNAGSRYLDCGCQFFADGPLFLAALVAGTHLYSR